MSDWEPIGDYPGDQQFDDVPGTRDVSYWGEIGSTGNIMVGWSWAILAHRRGDISERWQEDGGTADDEALAKAAVEAWLPPVFRVFVYGTLKPGQPRWEDALEPFAIRITDAVVQGQLFNTGYGFPAAIFDSAAKTEFSGVVVDIELIGEVLAILDQIEGEGHLYERIVIDIDGAPCWTYQWLHETDGFDLIDSWPVTRSLVCVERDNSEHGKGVTEVAENESAPLWVKVVGPPLVGFMKFLGWFRRFKPVAKFYDRVWNYVGNYVWNDNT